MQAVHYYHDNNTLAINKKDIKGLAMIIEVYTWSISASSTGPQCKLYFANYDDSTLRVKKIIKRV